MEDAIVIENGYDWSYLDRLQGLFPEIYTDGCTPITSDSTVATTTPPPNVPEYIGNEIIKGK